MRPANLDQMSLSIFLTSSGELICFLCPIPKRSILAGRVVPEQGYPNAPASSRQEQVVQHEAYPATFTESEKHTNHIAGRLSTSPNRLRLVRLASFAG
ncbi:hypothetical protein ES703_102063 [subsurface metagenome]